MSDDRIFIDTNIFVYAKLEDEKDKSKQEIATALLLEIENPIVISAQVLNEFSSVLIRHNVSNELIFDAVQSIANECLVAAITYKTVEQAWKTRNRYNFSYWDSLILASSIENACTTVYTEDMQHGQTIEGILKIVNPFSS